MSRLRNLLTVETSTEANPSHEGLDLCYNMVREYQIAFGNPLSEHPRRMNVNRRMLRKNFIEEELREFVEANNIENQCDALIDLIYFALGGLVELGTPPQKIFDIVHQANMKKSIPRVVKLKSSEKAEKPKGWVPPEDEILSYIDNLRKPEY